MVAYYLDQTHREVADWAFLRVIDLIQVMVTILSKLVDPYLVVVTVLASLVDRAQLMAFMVFRAGVEHMQT